jgi:MYXO-CTERM domain-containing protein
MALPVMTIDGDVIAVHSRWTADHSGIVTESTIRTDDGGEVVVTQLGGRVDDIGMITFPGPALLAPGMRVSLAAHKDVDLSQQEHVGVDDVKVLAYPPGYVRTTSDQATHPLHWESGCILVAVDPAGTMAIDGDAEFAVIDAAIEAWNHDTVTASCSYLSVINEGRKDIEVGEDEINLIKFRDTVWGRPAVDDEIAMMYTPGAAGLTTVKYFIGGDRDGAIVDADIELNGVNFAIAINGVSRKSGCIAELQNTLTHELGHLHGLQHTCLAPGDPPRQDNLGNPVPSCALTSDPRILDATMYNFQSCGETKKETLSPDDIQAMCDIYPVNQDPGACEHVRPPAHGGCGCASRDDRPEAPLALAAATFLVLLRRRRAASR